MASPATETSPVPIPTRATALAGFLLSGFLFALLGAILPAWGYYRDPPEFITVGNYFLSLSLGMIVSARLSHALLPRTGIRFLLVFSAALSCATLLYLAVVPPPTAPVWRTIGLALIGLDAGLLHPALFHAISLNYERDAAGTVNKAGIFFGLGCLAVTLLVARTFYAYTVPSILILMAAIPGYFCGIFARSSLPMLPAGGQPRLRHALRDFRSPGAVMFSLLLFLQFGNEWALAGWLSLFLIRRLGVSPITSLKLLAFYWLALLVGRVAAATVLPHVRHGRLLFGSVAAALFGYIVLYWTNNVFGAAMGILFVGAGFASIYPLVAERIGRRFPHYHPGFFNDIFSFGMMGGSLAPATLGYFASLWDIGVVMALPLIGTCLVSLLLLLIWLEAKVTGR